MNPFPNAPRLRGVVALALLALLPACATPGRHHAREAGPAVERQPALAPGYRARRQFAVAVSRTVWRQADETVDVTLTLPDDAGIHPLLVYLPGLGESADAGAPWRRAWAEAGYAVLSVQRTADVDAWSEPDARTGDFRVIAQEHFAAPGLARRLAVLRDALDRVRHPAGELAPTLARIDARHYALAGFDLGAQTALAAAGEADPGQPAFHPDDAPVSVLALSPYADLAAGESGARYRTIRGAVLSVTSEDDRDAYGLVTTPMLRQAPFRSMPPGDKYLLLFHNVPHAVIGGGAPTPETAPGERDPERGRRGRDRQGDEGGMPFGDGGWRGGSGDGGRGGGAGPGGGESRGGAMRAAPASTAAIETRFRSVSLAFLDATLGRDVEAGDWLALDARRWLGDDAELIQR